jgi:V8-like Glu-specific endopeptidase
MDRLTTLVEAIATDAALRQAFANNPERVLEAHGIDTSELEIPERMTLDDLEARLAAFSPTESSRETEPAGSGTSSSPLENASAPVGPPPVAEGDWRAGIQRRGLALPEFAARPGPESEAAGKPEAEVDLDAVYTDAWYASFGTAISRSFAHRRRETTRMVQELVVGQDDRVRVQNTNQTPYQWVCSLIITAGNGSVWAGTGWLASPRVVITAGHCVYLHNQGGWARRVAICPARDGANRPHTFTSTQPRSVAGWVVNRAPEHDYGAWLLEPNDAGHGLGYLGFGALEDANLLGLLANLVGYPSDKEPGTLWGHTRTLGSIRPSTLHYDIDTYGGMSGSPLIQWDGADYVAVGIHNYGDLAGNQATRITGDVFQNIQFWKAMAT